MSNELTSVGKSTIKAVINEKGTLNSFEAYAPYTMRMGTGIDDSSISMEMIGYSKLNYTFTR